MKRTIRIGLSLLVALPLLAISCGSEAEKDYIEVPLTFTDNGLPVITVKFADVAVLFVVDSGANCCLVDSATAEALELPPNCNRPSNEVVIQGETVRHTHVHDVSFAVENYEFMVKTLVIADMPSGPSDDFHGLLGMNFLRSAHAVIDIKGKRLLIQKPN